MRRLLLARGARQDLKEIAAFISRSSRSTAIARQFVARLRQRCERLAVLPGTLGASRPELGVDCRAVVQEGYVIVFQYEPGVLHVLHVFEGHRDILRQFNKT